MIAMPATIAMGGAPETRLQGRDRAAWDQLIAREYGRIYNLHLRLTGDRETAADLTQESFVEAYRGADTFSGRGRREAWLYGIALNRYRNWRRRDGRGDPPEELPEEVPDPAPTAEDLAALRERSDLVVGAVQRLPEMYQRTVALRYFAGLSTPEIAASEGVDEGTIRWRIHQALQKLWVMLKPRLGEGNDDDTATA
jgi:RNA polymerase sigma-70 factor (ECF subfamily)